MTAPACIGCGRPWRDEASPGEAHGYCAACYETDAACPMCGATCGAIGLCDCDEPLCVRCHRAVHVEVAGRRSA